MPLSDAIQLTERRYGLCTLRLWFISHCCLRGDSGKDHTAVPPKHQPTISTLCLATELINTTSVGLRMGCHSPFTASMSLRGEAVADSQPVSSGSILQFAHTADTSLHDTAIRGWQAVMFVFTVRLSKHPRMRTECKFELSMNLWMCWFNLKYLFAPQNLHVWEISLAICLV